MGFILEKYSENAAGLVVSFQQTADSDVFCTADSVEAAMEHFGLYKDESGNLKLKDANEEAMGDLGIKPDEAEELRSTLDEITAAITDEEALEHKVLFKLWQPGLEYQKDEKVRYGDNLYQCIQPHTSQADWMPPAVPALWRAFSEEQYPEWVQPLGAHDAYGKGDTVTHNGKKWASDVDGNTWEPGVYGWTEVQEPTAGEEANEG